MLKQKSYEISSVDEGHQILTKSRAVFFGTKTSFFGLHDIQKLPDFQDSFAAYESFGLQKDSEFAEMFDFHILAAFEEGIVDKIFTDWFLEEELTPNDVNEFQAVQVWSLVLPALVVLSGVALSIVIVLIEIKIKSSQV